MDFDGILYISTVLILQMNPMQVASVDLSPFIEITKLVIPALGAYFLSRMQAKKEQRIAQGSMEERTREQLAKQQEGVFAEYRSISLQSRDVVAESYRIAAEEKAARRIAEARADTLEAELLELKRKYNRAIDDLDELRTEMARREQRSGNV